VRVLCLTLLLAMAAPATVQAADFGFSVVLRAGAFLPLSTWEMGIGGSGAPSSTASFLPHYLNNLAYSFTIRYTEATNTARATFRNILGITHTVTYQPPGGTLTAPRIQWVFPASSFYVRAQQDPTASSITVSALNLSGALTVLQPLSATSLSASQNGGSGQTSALSGPVVFQTNAGSGDWQLTGLVTLTGTSWFGGGVAPNALTFGFSSEATGIQAVPEPPAWISLLAGLAAIAAGRGWRRIHPFGQAPNPPQGA
jgi:hypothetical protein